MDTNNNTDKNPLKQWQLDAILVGSEQRIVDLVTDKIGRFDEAVMDQAISLLELLQAAIRHNDAKLIASVVTLAEQFCRVIDDEDNALFESAHWIVTCSHWNDTIIKTDARFSATPSFDHVWRY